MPSAWVSPRQTTTSFDGGVGGLVSDRCCLCTADLGGLGLVVASSLVCTGECPRLVPCCSGRCPAACGGRWATASIATRGLDRGIWSCCSPCSSSLVLKLRGLRESTPCFASAARGADGAC